MKHFHIGGNYQMKTLCRDTGHQSIVPAGDAAEAARVNNQRDAADRRRRRAAEVDARCVSQAF